MARYHYKVTNSLTGEVLNIESLSDFCKDKPFPVKEFSSYVRGNYKPQWRFYSEMSKYEVVHDTVNYLYFKESTSNSNYLLGFLYADGSLKTQVSSKAKGTVKKYVRFTSIDLDVIAFAKREMKSYHSIITSHKESVIRQPMHTLEIGGSLLFDSLIELGLVPGKSLKDSDVTYDNKYEGAFWTGYMDGDGCVTYDRTALRIEVLFCERNAKMILRFKEFLESINCDFTVIDSILSNKMAVEPMTLIRIQKNDSLIRLIDKTYLSVEFSMKRKRDRILNWYGHS